MILAHNLFRTGSGKSSLIMSLVRLYDIRDGEILINNTNINELDLKTLRSKIVIIIKKY